MNTLKVVFKLILIFFFFVIALVGALGAYSSHKKVNDLKTWQPLSATVISTSIEEEHRSKGTTYCPLVKVGYAFLGQSQTSTLEIEDGACSPIQASVVGTIEKYKQGAVVSAFVNPENPSAIRVANFSRGTNFYLMLFITALGFVGVVYLWRTPANKLVNRDAKKAALS
jgi:hypothetical protein